MNAIISAIKNRKTILVANEARLLKKCFLGFIILSLAFQTGELGHIVRNSLIDAYIQVSVFVGFTLFVFLSLFLVSLVTILIVLWTFSTIFSSSNILIFSSATAAATG